jgi:signal peptidase
MSAQPKVTGVRRAARWAVNLLMVAVLALSALWLVPTLLGYGRYVITGPSMTGTYDKGSIVFEKPVAVADLRVGDVITYLPPADAGVPNLVTHRIVAIEPAQGGGKVLTTQGDANADPDPWHFRLVDAVQPVVRFDVPHAGWVFIGLADREIRMLLIGGPATVIALLALAELVGGVRETRRRPAAPAAAPVS